MLFNSFRFLVFFPTVVLFSYLLPSKWKKFFLLLASYVFYMSWHAGYALLILASTCVTWLCGMALARIRERSPDPAACRRGMNAAMTVSLLINLGILFYFKYFNFTGELLYGVLNGLGLRTEWTARDILLPVGISFYTFQAIGYTVDVYRGDTPAERNFAEYALFVSFFPQLVAGPIERSGHLLQELHRPAKFDWENIRDGFLLMLWGYFLKLVIADRAAVIVDAVYAAPGEFPASLLVLATALFALQIYCDFAGYSTIAMGAAKILGISLMDNFNAPYLSLTVAEFWRKWHISLTSWFRDYLYIPLGGSRRGKTRKMRNILIVFLVSGLWHGADLSFVIWGGLNGLYQVVGELLAPLRTRLRAKLHIPETSRIRRVISCVLTFQLVDFAWIFFRADSLENAFAVIRCMAAGSRGIMTEQTLLSCGLDRGNLLLLLLSVILLLLADFCKKRGLVIRERICRKPPWIRVLIVGISLYLLLLFGRWGPEFNASGFIYFQF